MEERQEGCLRRDRPSQHERRSMLEHRLPGRRKYPWNEGLATWPPCKVTRCGQAGPGRHQPPTRQAGFFLSRTHQRD